MMKWTIILFSIIELTGVILQYNDPDPMFWMVIYAIPLVLNFLYLGGKKLRRLNLGVLIVYAIYFLTFIPAFIDWAQLGFPSITGSMHAETPYIELVREGGGLLILLVNLALLPKPPFRKR